MRSTQCYVDFVYQLSMWSRAEKKTRNTSVDLAVRRAFRVHTDFQETVSHREKKKKMKVRFYQTLPDFRKKIAF